jgi:hypothetical protein
MTVLGGLDMHEHFLDAFKSFFDTILDYVGHSM